MNTIFRSLVLVCLLSGLLGLPVSTHAQNPQPSDPAAAPNLLAAFTMMKTLVGTDFYPMDGSLSFASISGGILLTSVSPNGNRFAAPLNLPSGAEITALEFYALDTTTGVVKIHLESCN